MKHLSVGGIILSLLLVSPAAAVKADGKKEQIAIQQAESWLRLVDAEQYADSWTNAAAFFRNAVPQEQWIASLKAYRKPLGKTVERKLKSYKYMTSLPAAPDGEYVVIQFETLFENKLSAIETITPMLDADGVWRVSGYFIK